MKRLAWLKVDGAVLDLQADVGADFPYVRNNLPAASTDPTMPTLVTLPFNMFSASMMPAPAQIVGPQWQVNSTSSMCTVELRLDEVAFIPAAPPLEPGADDGGASD